MIPATGWTCEVHELSEGFSAIVYDERGQMLADHLDEDRALLIAAAPDMLAALQKLVNSFEKHRPKEYWDAARTAIANATGIPS